MPIILDPISKVISVTSPTTSVTIGELISAIRKWEDELSSMTYDYVIDTAGKDDLGSSIYTALVMTLMSTWKVQFWNGVSLGIIRDGTLVGDIMATGGSDTTIVLNTVGGVITVTGSGITDQDKTDIIEGTWDESKSSHVIDGTFGKAINDVEDDATLLLDESGGKWEIVANQMIFYKADNITEIQRFNLYDASGNPTMTAPYKRERV